MSESLYTIADDPKPGSLQNATVNPVWPLFATMFAGTWLAWPWYAFNAYAMGSPTKTKETRIVVLGFLVSILYVSLVFALSETIPKNAVPYILLVLTAWKLGVSYWLHVCQSRTLGLYEYYGGIVRNGIGIVFLGAILFGQFEPKSDLQLFIFLVLR